MPGKRGPETLIDREEERSVSEGDEGVDQGKREVESQVKETNVRVAWVLRDSMQSLLSQAEDWVSDPELLAELVELAQETGFPVLEIAGGRFTEISYLNGTNPFKLIRAARDRVLSLARERGERPVDFSALFRGPQVTGYEPCHPSVQEAIIREHVESGITVGRHFDGLNDIDNLDFYREGFDGVQESYHAQFAMAFSRGERYTDEYYVNLALEGKKRGAKSICIKDTAGLIREERIRTLVPALKKATGLDIVLHTHSTDHKGSKDAIRAAVECGIDQIEISVLPLAGGTAHHNIEELLQDPVIGPKIKISIDLKMLQALRDKMESIFSGKETVGHHLSQKILQILLEADVPGGAAPSVLAFLKDNFGKFFEMGNETALENLARAYASELKRVRKDAGFPPPITPFADICQRQAAFNVNALRSVLNLTPENLAEGFREPENLSWQQRYQTVTRPFLDMCRGHYGFIRDYRESDEMGNYKIDGPSPEFRAFVLKQPVAYGVGETPSQETEFEDYYETGNHLASRVESLPDQAYFMEKVEAFKTKMVRNIRSYGIEKSKAEALAQMLLDEFGTPVQCSIAWSQKPKGKTDDFVGPNIILGYLKGSDESLVFQDQASVESFVEDIVSQTHSLSDMLTGVFSEKAIKTCFEEVLRSTGEQLESLESRRNDLEQEVHALTSEKECCSWIQFPSDKLKRLHRCRAQLSVLGSRIEELRKVSELGATGFNQEEMSEIRDRLIDVVKANLYQMATVPRSDSSKNL